MFQKVNIWTAKMASRAAHFVRRKVEVAVQTLALPDLGEPLGETCAQNQSCFTRTGCGAPLL